MPIFLIVLLVDCIIKKYCTYVKKLTELIYEDINVYKNLKKV